MPVDNVRVVYKDIKQANLKVKPTGDIVLTVPHDMSEQEIVHILKKREPWMAKHLDFFQKNRQEEKELVSGENFKYLGANYRLKIIESQKECTRLTRGYFEIYVKDTHDYKRKEALMESWYRKKAENIFFQIIEKYTPIVKVDINLVRMRAMKTRWGSCNPKKSYINLNLELIKKSKKSIEYVIFHELAHLVHHNHDKKFYNYLSVHMPDWRARKAKLEA